MKTAFVTGCAGLVGHGITSFLVKSGYKVFGSSRRPLKAIHPKFEPLIFDLNKKPNSQVIEALGQSDLVIHCAAEMMTTDIEKKAEIFYTTNVLGTLNLIESLPYSGSPKKFIFVSGVAVVANSEKQLIEEDDDYNVSHPYLGSKACAEVVVKQFTNAGKIEGCIFRIRAPYGYRPTAEAVIPKFLKLAQLSQDIPLLGTGSRQQVFTFVDDIGYACTLVFDKFRSGTFNIAGAKPITMKQLAETVIKVVDKTNSKIIFTGKPDPQEGLKTIVALERAEKEFGFCPRVDLTEGLQKIVKKDFTEFLEV